MNEHLERAREYLAIAESGDAKREAYKAAAEEIAAHKEETGEANTRIATRISKDEGFVRRLLRWRDAGCPEGTTPFTMADPSGSLPTDRASVSHTRRVLREADAEEVERIVESLPPAARRRLAAATDRVEDRTRRLPRPDAMDAPERSHAYVGIDGRLATATNELRRAIDAARQHEWSGEERELLEERVAELRQLLTLIELAVTDTADVDWDAELANLTGGAA